MRLLILAVYAALATSAFAQDSKPQEIIASDTVFVVVGKSRTFMFDEVVSDIHLSSSGIAQIVPLTDRTFSVLGLKPGEVLAIAYGGDNRTVHRMNVVVGPVKDGHLVKMYGVKEAVGGYASYYCGDIGCGRANPDVERGPDKTTITETLSRPNGDAVTIGREYR